MTANAQSKVTEKPRPGATSIRGLVWSRTKARLVDVAPRALRVAAVLATAWIIGLVVTERQAKADIHEVMLGFGAQMMRFDNADTQGAPRELWVNGQRMMLATASTRHSLRTVLDYYEARCMSRDGNLASQLQELAHQRAPSAPLLDRRALDSTMRFDSNARGFVACLDMGPNQVTLAQLGEKLRDFKSTGDLASVGNLRYVYATDEGDRTHILTFWTDDHFMIGRIFPSQGDAPGRDPAHVSRPPGARRLLSSWEEGAPDSVTVYAESSQNAPGLEAFYRRTLPGQGWTLLADGRSRYAHSAHGDADLGHGRVIAAERDRDTVFVVVDDGQDGKGVVTVVMAR